MEYPIEIKKDEEHFLSYYCRAKNSVGQTLLFEIYFYEWRGGRPIFNITFSIKNKHKHLFPENQITGKDGSFSLIWAYRCLKASIEFLKCTKPNAVIEVYGDSKRKHAIYKRYLIPLGFKPNQSSRGTLRLYIDSID